MVVYCLKFVLRGESPRDYVDMLRSLRFPPSIKISDIPHRLASHANRTVPGFFRPHDGRLFRPSPENIRAAEEGKLILHLPWLQDVNPSTTLSPDVNGSREDVHPSTGVKDRYSLSDRFHERNSSSKPDLLRRVTLVPEINAIINTEVEEQLHNSINRSNCSLNMMSPVNHLFTMRLKLHYSNRAINEAYRARLHKTMHAHSGPNVVILLDGLGRLTVHKGKRALGMPPTKSTGKFLTTTSSTSASDTSTAASNPSTNIPNTSTVTATASTPPQGAGTSTCGMPAAPTSSPLHLLSVKATVVPGASKAAVSRFTKIEWCHIIS